MVKHLIMLALAIFLVSACVHAADANTAITQEEMQALLAEIRGSAADAKTEIVIARMDTEMRDLFNKLEGKMTSVEQKVTTFEERFVAMKNELSTKIESSATLTETNIETKMNTKISESHTETQQYVRDMTNPIRINLPNLALWLMVTALFMLTAGLRMKTAVKDAKKEIEENKAVSEEWLK